MDELIPSIDIYDDEYNNQYESEYNHNDDNMDNWRRYFLNSKPRGNGWGGQLVSLIAPINIPYQTPPISNNHNRRTTIYIMTTTTIYYCTKYDSA